MRIQPAKSLEAIDELLAKTTNPDHRQMLENFKAHLTAEIACDDETSAKAMAALLQERLADVNGLVVRMLTHDLLGGLSVAAAGHNVELRLPATREQLESLAALASGLLAPIHSAEGRTTDGRKAVPP